MARASMLFVLPVAYVLRFLFGYPVFVVLRRFGLLGWWSSMTAGALLGGAVCMTVLGFDKSLFSMFTASGACVGLLAWLVDSHAISANGARQRNVGTDRMKTRVPRVGGND